jgi:tetratricopeptide (TPR) repeat protein
MAFLLRYLHHIRGVFSNPHQTGTPIHKKKVKVDNSISHMKCVGERWETCRGSSFSALILFIVIVVIYSNSVGAIWTLDDGQNILKNSRIHIEDLQFETLLGTMYLPPAPNQGENSEISRPLAQLSFALNWYVGKDSPIGYRVVNIVIHCLTAFFLFLTIRDLLRTIALPGGLANTESIALLSSLLWAVNPIQSQAVVYIVQRMSLLAGLFYLVSMWTYIRGRLAEPACRWRWYVAAVLAFAAAAGAKENSLILPATIILVEATFFWDRRSRGLPRRLVLMISIWICLVLALVAWLFKTGQLACYLDYSGRLFTLTERLLTQPRVLLFYLSQIAYPIPLRLSIEHDVEISRSLLDPWTTTPAILLVLAIVILSLIQIRRRPLISFAVLFYFLNHVIESSIIPLELIFEHRNYLPSLFLSVPVAIWLLKMVAYCRERQVSTRYLSYVFPLMLVIALGAGTYIRNMAWLDARTFWEDAIEKAPMSMRPVHNLAYEHYAQIGDAATAFSLYHKELTLRGYNRRDISIAHVNLANHHFSLSDYGAAIHHLERALLNYPEFEMVQYLLAFVLSQTEQLHRAIDVLRPLLVKRPDFFDYHFLAAQILLKSNMLSEGLGNIRHCLRLSKASVRALFMTGIALNLSEYPIRAEWFFHLAHGRIPEDKRALLWIIDCKLKQADELGARWFAAKLINSLYPKPFQASVVRELSDGFMQEKSIEDIMRWIQASIDDPEFRAENKAD